MFVCNVNPHLLKLHPHTVHIEHPILDLRLDQRGHGRLLLLRLGFQLQQPFLHQLLHASHFLADHRIALVAQLVHLTQRRG